MEKPPPRHGILRRYCLLFMIADIFFFPWDDFCWPLSWGRLENLALPFGFATDLPCYRNWSSHKLPRCSNLAAIQLNCFLLYTSKLRLRERNVSSRATEKELRLGRAFLSRLLFTDNFQDLNSSWDFHDSELQERADVVRGRDGPPLQVTDFSSK